MERPVADEPGRGGIPEGGRAAVAERDLVALGQAEELVEARPDPRDQVPHGLLAVRGPHQVVLLRELGQRLRPHLRGAAAEASVGRLQVSWDFHHGLRHRSRASRKASHRLRWALFR
jgi:hypothetical protein